MIPFISDKLNLIVLHGLAIVGSIWIFWSLYKLQWGWQSNGPC